MPHTEQAWTDFGAAELTFGSTVLGKTVANPGGGTHGGVRMRASTALVDSMRDAKGDQPHGGMYQGTVLEVEATFAGLSREQLAVLIPGAELSAGPTSKALTIKTSAGVDARDFAQTLTLKPLIGEVPSTDPDDFMVFEKAAPQINADVIFKMNEQKVVVCVFKIYGAIDTGILAVLGMNAT